MKPQAQQTFAETPAIDPTPTQPRRKRKKKKLRLKAVFTITWVHLVVMLALVIVAGIVADALHDDNWNNPVSNTAMWLFMIGLVAEVYWIPRTVIQAIATLVKRPRR